MSIIIFRGVLSPFVTYQYRIQLVPVFDRFGVGSLDEVFRPTGHSEGTLGVLYSISYCESNNTGYKSGSG